MDWPGIYSRIITATGWTPEQIDGMCFSYVLDLIEYWKESLPVHDLIALRYLGPRQKRMHIKRTRTRSSRVVTLSEDEQFSQISQIPQLVSVLGTPVRKMSEKTRALYEYAESVLKPKVPTPS